MFTKPGVLLLFITVIPSMYITNAGLYAQTPSVAERPKAVKDSIYLADPTIFHERGIYYLYGTGGNVNHGFQVYTSKDLKVWNGPSGFNDGYALIKGESYGTTGFWAPQVFKYKKKYYMAYTANEHIAIAESNTPLGPFRQNKVQPLSGNGKQIDPYVFVDRNGKTYLYHVKLAKGNRIYVSEMKEDLSDIIPGTEKECIVATEGWENTAQSNWPVAEGPTVLKMRSRYYLFYSANDFRNIDYAMGYAAAQKPSGPWTKYAGNPVLSRKNTGIHGTGHGDFFKKRRREWLYVFHTHKSNQRVSPRVTAIIRCNFIKRRDGTFQVTADTSSLYFPERREN
jgi:beta-xylosidase